MPNKNTFDIPAIGKFVRHYLEQSNVSVDPYARDKRWATYTNDLNPATAAEFHADAEQFLWALGSVGVVADLVIVDPPYSPRQVKECYDSIGLKMAQDDALLGKKRGLMKAAIARLVPAGGVVLHFGWNTVGMGLKHGYEQEEILLVCHGSNHNDTICLAERRVK